MEILAAVTALVAVVLSPAITFFVTRYTIKNQLDIAKRQIRSQTVSASRQAWIDALRNDVAEFMSLLVRITLRPSRGAELMPTIIMLEMRVNLRLNHHEKPHVDLSTRMQVAGLYAVSTGNIDQSDLEAVSQAGETLRDHLVEIRELTSLIVKQEWDRIKEGE